MDSENWHNALFENALQNHYHIFRCPYQKLHYQQKQGVLALETKIQVTHLKLSI